MPRNTTAIMEIRRCISCWAKPGQFRARARVVVVMPEHHGQRQEDQRHEAAGPRGVPERGGVHAAASCGQPLTEKTFAVVAHEPDRLLEARQLVERPLAPDDGGGGDEVGLDAAGAGGRDQHPVGLGAVARPRIDDVVDVTVARPPGPDRGGRAGQAAVPDGHHLVDLARPGSTTRGRCRSAHPPVGGGPATATSPPRLTSAPRTDAAGDAGRGPVGGQCLGGRAEVETDTARDADGAVARIELHVLVARDRAQRLRAVTGGRARTSSRSAS